MTSRVQVDVDSSACEATGLCVDVAPELFRYGGEGFAEAVHAIVPSDLADRAAEAADLCPTRAIRLRLRG